MASKALAELSPASAVAPVPSAHPCGGGPPVELSQKGDARHHGAACRQRAYRKRRRAEALDRIDAEVARLRGEVEKS